MNQLDVGRCWGRLSTGSCQHEAPCIKRATCNNGTLLVCHDVIGGENLLRIDCLRHPSSTSAPHPTRAEE